MYRLEAQVLIVLVKLKDNYLYAYLFSLILGNASIKKGL